MELKLGPSLGGKPHLSLPSPHQLLDVAAPAEQLAEPPHRHLQVSQLHVVAPAERRPLERPHGVPVEEETWDCGANRVDQAGAWLDLSGERTQGRGFWLDRWRISPFTLQWWDGTPVRTCP